MIKCFVPLVVFGFLLVSCAPKQAQQPTPESEEIIIFEEEPTTEETVIEEGELLTEETPTEVGPLVTEEEEPVVPPTQIEETPPPPPPPTGVTYGYRVQILAASTKAKADQFASEAQARFTEQRVYVEYIPPYYKVRIGDFVTRAEADAFLSKVKSLGYFDAFVTESQITPQR